MMKFNSASLASLRIEMNAALMEVAKKHGIVIQVKNASYSPDQTNAHFKVDLSSISDDGVVMSKEAQDYKRYAPLCGLDPDLLFQTVTFGGTDYKIIGYLPRSTRFPVLAEKSDGSKVKLTEAIAKKK